MFIDRPAMEQEERGHDKEGQRREWETEQFKGKPSKQLGEKYYYCYMEQ